MKLILGVLVVTAVVAAASAGAAQAQVITNETVSYHYSGYVPCANGGAGELLTGTIDVHNLVTSTVNGNLEASQFEFQPHGTLVGRITGDAYRLTGVTRGTSIDQQQNGEYVLTYVSSYQLIGPGTGNNLRVRETAHITSNGDDVIVQHDDWSIDCA